MPVERLEVRDRLASNPGRVPGAHAHLPPLLHRPREQRERASRGGARGEERVQHRDARARASPCARNFAARSRAFAAAASRSARGRAALGLVSFDDPKPGVAPRVGARETETSSRAGSFAGSNRRNRRVFSRGRTFRGGSRPGGFAASARAGSKYRDLKSSRSASSAPSGSGISARVSSNASVRTLPAPSRGRSPKGAEEDGIASCALGRKSEAARSASSTTSSKSNAYPSSPPSMARAPRDRPAARRVGRQ